MIRPSEVAQVFSNTKCDLLVNIVCTGVLMSRDIVQFVPFRDFKNRPLSELAKETLAEIPSQVHIRQIILFH